MNEINKSKIMLDNIFYHKQYLKNIFFHFIPQKIYRFPVKQFGQSVA